jgi:pimeloyl-ACP methyl ester carboxylesterase
MCSSSILGPRPGLATTQQLFDYYLGWLTDPSITNHFQLISDSSVAFAKGWGLNVEIQDLHRVVEAAKQGGRTVVMGGHSLGGSITTAYATWDFHGHAGADDLAGLVYIDGGSGPTPVTPAQAQESLASLQTGSPWLAFGGIGAPFLGLFSALGSTTAVMDPNSASLAQSFAFLPANLKPPFPVTNEAQFGYDVDTKTSPPNLLAAQVHAGQLAASGDPRGWVRAGAITPIERYAEMLSGYGSHRRRFGVVPPDATDDRRRRRRSSASTRCTVTISAKACASTPSPPRSAARACSLQHRFWLSSRTSRLRTSRWSTVTTRTHTTTRRPRARTTRSFRT